MPSMSTRQSTPTTVSAREVFGLAFPALGVLAAMPLYLLLDTAVVGRLGAQELASLAAATTIHTVVTTQLTFLSYGTTARSSRLFGAGKRAEAVAEGVQATYVALGVGGLLAIIMWIFGGVFAQWLTGDPTTAAGTALWLRIAALAIPVTLVEMAGNGWMRGVQNTKKPLYFTLAGMIPGAIAVPAFVYWWGLAGSAIATVMGMSIIASLFVRELYKQHEGSWAFRWHIVREQLILGRDLILRSASFQVAFLTATAVVSRVGTAALGGHQIMMQLWNFMSLILDSLAIAAQALTGAALGAGSARHARSVGSKVVMYSTIFSAFLALVFAAGAGVIPRVFTSSQEVIDAMSQPWWILVGMVIAGGVVFALDGVLLGAGDAAFLRSLTIASVLLGFLPGVLLAHAMGTGLTGVWCGLAAFISFRLIGVVYRFYSMKWAVIAE